MKEECILCLSTDSLIESGGQFCGGDWWLCAKCNEEAERATAFFKSELYFETLKKVIRKEKV